MDALSVNDSPTNAEDKPNHLRKGQPEGTLDGEHYVDVN